MGEADGGGVRGLAPAPAGGAERAPNAFCVLCEQTALGFATNERSERLCHHEARDCYHLWTVYGARPGYVCHHPAARVQLGWCGLCGGPEAAPVVVGHAAAPTSPAPPATGETSEAPSPGESLVLRLVTPRWGRPVMEPGSVWRAFAEALDELDSERLGQKDRGDVLLAERNDALRALAAARAALEALLACQITQFSATVALLEVPREVMEQARVAARSPTTTKEGT